LECRILFLKNYPPGLPPPGDFSRWLLAEKNMKGESEKGEKFIQKEKNKRKMELKC
jgi:hypothetical protein